MRKVKIAVLSILFFMLLSGCSQNTDAIIVDIGVSDASEVSVSSVRESLEEWERAHPDISVEERRRIRDEDFMNLASMGVDHMPDVFITDYLNARILEQEGLIMDINEYSFPIFDESAVVVISDPDLWNEDDTISFCTDGGYSAADCLSVLLADSWGQEWLAHMDEGDREASFTDPEFVSRLQNVQALMSGNVQYGSCEELAEAFASGNCSAVLVGGNEVYRFLENIKINNQSLYDKIVFSTLADDPVPHEYQYGVFLSAGLQGERLDRCIDLAQSLHGSFCVDPDGTYDRLNSLIDDPTGVRLITLCFSPLFWEHASEDCLGPLMRNEITAEDCSYMLQDLYEQYYLLSVIDQ